MMTLHNKRTLGQLAKQLYNAFFKHEKLQIVNDIMLQKVISIMVNDIYTNETIEKQTYTSNRIYVIIICGG